MLGFSIRLLKEPTVIQIDEAVSLCLRAYEGDEGLECLVCGDMSLAEPLFRAMVRATALEGEFYVAVNDSEKILGLGLWFGPGKDLFSTEQQRNLGFNDFLGRLSPEAQTWWTQTYPAKMGEFLSYHLGPQGKSNSYYLNCLATDPTFQRRGVATQIVETVFQKAIAIENRLVLIATNAKTVCLDCGVGMRYKADHKCRVNPSSRPDKPPSADVSQVIGTLYTGFKYELPASGTWLTLA
ncbi:hypothetical protein EWM64_g862 [Hericium alpestre]|uniref:N-acetyltransferase domain-containing protein n=1 Tax=Hericium alpestre TaxID=135208 RepID=A0A4Z0AA18_9AGAM|nr:hypothetical protein EWM64_g862 [Hericium alpestre]